MNDDAPLRIYLVAGEASGDAHAAHLVRAIRALSPRPVVFRGIGGAALRAAGQEQLMDCDSIAVVGIVEVLKRLRFFARLLRRTTDDMRDWKPDALLTGDYPGFNLRLAANAKKLGIRTIHYICPQVWVWHRSRIWKIAETIDTLITIFPFEPACFEPTKLRPVFAGHPLVDRAAETLASPEAPLPWLPGSRRVAILPGSRPSEIATLLPTLLGAAARLEGDLGQPVSFVLPASSSRIRVLVESVIARTREKPSHLAVVDGGAREVLRQAEAAAVASGTATLEASLMLCPTILVYRGSFLSYLLARFVLRKVGCLGIANLITGTRVMPELLQYDFTPAQVSAALAAYLTDAAARAKALDGLREANAALGDGNSAERAARVVLDALRATPSAGQG